MKITPPLHRLPKRERGIGTEKRVAMVVKVIGFILDVDGIGIMMGDCRGFVEPWMHE
jgi:hypothetical protein